MSSALLQSSASTSDIAARAMFASHQVSSRPNPPIPQPEGIEGLYWDNEDDSFEVPDFHFDWGMSKEKSTSPSGAPKALHNQVKPSISLPDHSERPSPPDHALQKHGTPASHSGQSASSSASSDHLLSRTDASSFSSSSPAPTPPGSLISRSLSGYRLEDGSGGIVCGREPKTIGTRNFQRVVSAPISAQVNSESNAAVDESQASHRQLKGSMTTWRCADHIEDNIRLFDPHSIKYSPSTVDPYFISIISTWGWVYFWQGCFHDARNY